METSFFVCILEIMYSVTVLYVKVCFITTNRVIYSIEITGISKRK